MKKVIISVGPIPAKLDSVKFITNRFKGGLAFKTAQYLRDMKYDVTIIKHIHTEIPESFKTGDNLPKIINIGDVYSYCEFFERNAINYDGFIMAGAVANLAPVSSYVGKFPSHNYKVGEYFDIQFCIAPRAIDIIKKKNPRCTLIGYKLFDGEESELIRAAQLTMDESNANIIFANTPTDAKRRKLALMRDGAVLDLTFDEHLHLIHQALSDEYFTTVIQSMTEEEERLSEIERAIAAHYDKTFVPHGTMAIRVPALTGVKVVTTSRGHEKPPVLIHDIDYENRIIYASGKATLNIPMLYKALTQLPEKSYIMHRHEPHEHDLIYPIEHYTFPGTVNEVKFAAKLVRHGVIIQEEHGYCEVRQIGDIDWNKYYEQFPEKYFGTHPDIVRLFETANAEGKEILEVGGNSKTRAEYALDTGVYVPNAVNITYENLAQNQFKFDLIICNNAAAYLTNEQIDLLITALAPNGQFIANAFWSSDSAKTSEFEFAIPRDGIVHHTLFCGDEIVQHSFDAQPAKKYEAKGFTITPYGTNSCLISYKKND